MKSKTMYMLMGLLYCTLVFAQSKNTNAIDAIETTVDFYVEQHKNIELPSEIKNKVLQETLKEEIQSSKDVQQLINIERERYYRSQFFQKNPSLSKAFKALQTIAMVQEVVDFEGGNLGGFALVSGDTNTSTCPNPQNSNLSPQTINTDVSNTANAFATLVDSGLDELVELLNNQPQNSNVEFELFKVSSTSGGNRALRINQKRMFGNDNHEVDIVTKTFVTDGSDVSFDLAMVMDYWGFNREDHNAYFRAAVVNSSGNAIDEICIEATNFMSGFQTLNYDDSIDTDVFLKFRQWQTETLSTGPAGGVVSLVFEAGDCADVAHAGYAYVDNIIIGTQPDNCNACNITPVITPVSLDCGIELSTGPACNTFTYNWEVTTFPGGNVITQNNSETFNTGFFPNFSPDSIQATLTITDLNGCSSSTTETYDLVCGDPPPVCDSCGDVGAAVLATIEDTGNCLDFEITVTQEQADCYIIRYGTNSALTTLPVGTTTITKLDQLAHIGIYVYNFDYTQCSRLSTLPDCSRFNNKSLIYPNPYKQGEILTLSNLNERSIQNIEVLNLSGKTVRSITSKKTSFVLNDIKSGVYWIRVTTNEVVRAYKLVVDNKN